MDTMGVVVGVGVVKVTFPFTLINGAHLYSDPDNTAQVFYGTRSTVTADCSATSGFPVEVGHDTFIPNTHFDRPKAENAIWLISTVADQKVFLEFE